MIYDQEHGFSPMRTLLHLADTSGLIDGRNPYRYFKGHPEFKFDSRDVGKLIDNPDFRQTLMDTCMSVLKGYLGESANERGNDAQSDVVDYTSNVLPALFDSYEEEQSESE
jgi:hypothetical protein